MRMTHVVLAMKIDKVMATTGFSHLASLQQQPRMDGTVMVDESTALLGSSTTNDHSNERSSSQQLTGQATRWQTIANLMKTCMGTGCLALAYACQQGGVVVYIVGLVAIAAWNYVCISRLLKCLDFIPTLTSHKRNEHTSFVSNGRREGPDGQDSTDTRVPEEAYGTALDTRLHPPLGTSTLGRVAWYAFGNAGLQLLNVMVVILLLGIIIAYVAAVMSFTPFTAGRLLDACVTGLVMGLISLVPDLGYLSGASAAGLVVLLLTFAVISGYGVYDRLNEDDHDAATTPHLEMWPSSLNGLSRWFGIVVFGYGVVPLTYNFRESMKEPEHMAQASIYALVGVAALYIITGVGLYALFPTLTADVLHELPATGLLPILTRIAMSGTVLTTAPLLIVPCAELLEGKFGITHAMPMYRALVRFGVVGVCVLVAVVLPNFVQVLSFVGCFCVALVSFCLPPILHLRLVYLAHEKSNTALRQPLTGTTILADIILGAWGVIVTVVSTLCTLRN